MNTLDKLTIQSLRLNKKRTIVTIIGIILSVALLSALLTLAYSFYDSMIASEREQGDYHVVFRDVECDRLKDVKENRNIEKSFGVSAVGYSRIEKPASEFRPYIYIAGYDKTAMKNMGMKLIEGRCPENENELVVQADFAEVSGLACKVGDTIALEVGRRVSDGYELGQMNPYSEDAAEELIELMDREYTIVGVMQRPSYDIEDGMSPGYATITCTDNASTGGVIDIYARFTKEALKDYAENSRSLAEYLTGDVEGYEGNLYLISLETGEWGNDMVGLKGAVGIVCIIIILTSVFCIKNSFDISITEKTKQYGMLRSIGATKKQIRKNVFFEAGILGCIGIPAGIVSGIVAAKLLIMITNYLLLGEDTNMEFDLTIRVPALLLTVLLGAVTIILSAYKSAHRAGRITPLESIRSTNDIKLKHVKGSKLVDRLFGIGGEISRKNLKRNKKKYRTTSVSIFISVLVFVVISYFFGLFRQVIDFEYNYGDYNISIYVWNMGDKELGAQSIRLLKNLEGVDRLSIMNSDCWTSTNIPVTLDYAERFSYSTQVSWRVCALEDSAYAEYIKELGLDAEKVSDKAIVYTSIIAYDYNSSRRFLGDCVNVSQNDTIKLEYYEESEEAEGELVQGQLELAVGYVTDELPFSVERDSQPIMIIPLSEYAKLVNDVCDYEAYIYSEKPQQIEEAIYNIDTETHFSVTNHDSDLQMMNNIKLWLGIFMYGFIAVISLIGVTNIFNTITTGMQLRQREFAMLRSIGMTDKEFNRMVGVESLMLGIKSLVIGIILSGILSYKIYLELGNGDGFYYVPFKYPVVPSLAAILAVLLLITCIMRYSIRKINKQNLIETIRNENI